MIKDKKLKLQLRKNKEKRIKKENRDIEREEKRNKRKYKVEINIFLVCYNEEIIIPLMFQHYKKWLPGCNITILDNYSIDKSADIAKKLGCKVIYWSTGNELDEPGITHIRNTCWKNVNNGWVIVADMDEWLCVTKEQLKYEEDKGTTFLNSFGIHLLGDSKKEDLSDINVHKINRGWRWRFKPLCFFRPKIKETNFTLGMRKAIPNGKYILSEKEYVFKHAVYLGLKYYIKKTVGRKKRCKVKTQIYNTSTHYTDDIEIIKKKFKYRSLRSSVIPELKN